MRNLLLILAICMSAFANAQTKVLYGMTGNGGINGRGVLFEYNPQTGIYTKKFDFSEANGENPQGSLMQALDGKLYGMTMYGGTNRKGVLFEYNTQTGIYTKKFDFGGANGENPEGSLIQAFDGKLYGLTGYGGQSGEGVLFEYDPVTNIYAKKFDFGITPGSYPLGSYAHGSLMQASNGKFYGMTNSGGGGSSGILFEYDPVTGAYKKFDFGGTNGTFPRGSLMQASDGLLYGMAYTGGAGYGVMFAYNPANNAYTKTVDFDGANGANPFASMTQAFNGKLYGLTGNGGAYNNGVLFEYNSVTSIYAKKFDFSEADGVNPRGTLVQASNGRLYGMTFLGGSNGTGVLFEYDPANNAYSKKVDFNGTNGGYPYYTQLTEVTLNDAAMPVLFGSISAIIKNTQLQVNWTTESERNNNYFEIEISADGKKFEKVGQVQSKGHSGNSAVPLDYFFSIASATTMSLAGTGIVIILCGWLLFARKKKRLSILPVMAGCLLFAFVACSKNEVPVYGSFTKTFIRIVQVDIDGTRGYSKITQVRNE